MSAPANWREHFQTDADATIEEPQTVEIRFHAPVYVTVDLGSGAVTKVSVDDENPAEFHHDHLELDAGTFAKAVAVAEEATWPRWSFG